jgi:glucosyl-3-phosphoglycerate synthase
VAAIVRLNPEARDLWRYVVLSETARWLGRRTWHDPRWSARELRQAKGARRISVVLPALNEAATVGDVVASVLPLVGPVVDECVVMDSGSTDATIERARAAGARVVRHRDVLPELAVRPGKGEVLWRSLAATDSDILVFLDSDLIDPDPGFVPALLGPILHEPGVHQVKSFYRRPLRIENPETGMGGGRVTELLARPVLSALRPQLSGIIQPLGGEFAITRELGESVPFAPGYGVEIGLLLDTYERYGLDGLAQVNLGARKHRNRSLPQLGVMARQILGTALARCGLPAERSAPFVQFIQVDGEWLPDEHDVQYADRPPMRDVLSDPARLTLP